MSIHSETPEKNSNLILTKKMLLIRLGCVGAVVATLAGGFAFVAGWFSPARLTPDRIVDAFERANKSHPGFRRNHAKGVCLVGDFEGNGQGVRLSKAIVFNPGHVPVTGRFAFAGGQPFMADNQKAVRSMALLFKLPNGEEWRTGMNNTPVFTVNTPDGFYQQIVASTPDPQTGKVNPSKMNAFLEKHPETVRARAIISTFSFSSGFEDATFNSLNAFRFINRSGTATAVRWSMVPTPIPTLDGTTPDTNSDSENYLFNRLIRAVSQTPLQWHLVVTIGQPGDTTNDATVPWPITREKVDVGTLTVSQIEVEDIENCRDINFDPLVLPVGIVKSDDPLLPARSAAYSQSFTRRVGEDKRPSAVNLNQKEMVVKK